MICCDILGAFPEEFHDLYPANTHSGLQVRPKNFCPQLQGAKRQRICLFLFSDLQSSDGSLNPISVSLQSLSDVGLGGGAGDSSEPPHRTGDKFGINSAFLLTLTLSELSKSSLSLDFLSAGISGEICINFFSYYFFIFISFSIFCIFFLRTLFNPYPADEQLYVLWIRTFAFTMKKPQTSSVESF